MSNDASDILELTLSVFYHEKFSPSIIKFKIVYFLFYAAFIVTYTHNPVIHPNTLNALFAKCTNIQIVPGAKNSIHTCKSVERKSVDGSKLTLITVITKLFPRTSYFKAVPVRSEKFEK